VPLEHNNFDNFRWTCHIGDGPQELEASTVKWLLEKREIKPEVIAELVPHLAGYSFDIRQWLLTCPPSALETTIRQGVIAKFDVDVLQPLRDSFQRNRDELNRFILLLKKDRDKGKFSPQ